MLDVFISLITFIVVLGILVFLHELGHFLTALRYGVGVLEFALGMPPRIKKWTRNNIDFALNAVPIGGYVRLLGEEEESDDPRSFQKKPPYQRLIVLLAGSCVHLLLALILFSFLVLVQGKTAPTAQVVILQTDADTPAQTAGIIANDEVLRVGDQRIFTTADFLDAVTKAAGAPTEFTIYRPTSDQILHVLATPRIEPPAGQGPLGVTVAQGTINYPVHLGQALLGGSELCFSVVKGTLQTLGDTAVMIFSKAKIPEGISGPVGIARATGDFYQNGGLFGLVFLTALLAANLAVFNLLPLPGLDGGRILFVLIEWLRGKKVSHQKESLVHGIGLLLLFAFLAAITYRDVLNLF